MRRDAAELFGAVRQIKEEILKVSRTRRVRRENKKTLNFHENGRKIELKSEKERFGKYYWAVSFVYTPHPTIIAFSALICCCHHQPTS